MMKKRWNGGRLIDNRPAKKAKTVAAAVSRLQRQVALLKPEVKTFFSEVAAINVTQAAGFIQAISLIRQGTDINNRVGDSVRGVKLGFKGEMSDNGGGTSVRVLIIRDSDSNGTTPVIGGAVSAVFVTGFVARIATQRSETKKRFTILYDKYLPEQAYTNGAMGAGYFEWESALSSVTSYLSDGATTASASKNQYYMVVLVDGADTADFNFMCRFDYSDV